MTDMVKVKVDGQEIEVPKGTLAIRAAERAGVYIPRFCDHPLLDPVAACRACLVEISMPNREGVVSKMPKPQPACSTTVAPNMEIHTQLSSPVARKAQNGVLELLLVNHPLDCPVCDKAGECPLQNQTFLEGNPTSRFTDAKRVMRKPVRLTAEILLDNERCVLCQRCVRFGKEIAGDAFIDLQGRGGGSSPVDHHDFLGERIGSFDTQVLGFYDQDSNPDAHTVTDSALMTGPSGQAGVIGTMHSGNPGVEDRDVSGRRFASYFSGNITQICPVGALTNTSYRFRARPHDLTSTPAITDQDASGAQIRVDARRGVVLRQMAGEAPEVNEEWISDKDRYAYKWQSLTDRIQRPMVRDQEGKLVEVDWGTALTKAAQLITQSSKGKGVGFLPGGRLTLEDYYAWSKFARVVAKSNLVDSHARDFCLDEFHFIRTRVAARPQEVTYADLEQAPFVLLVGLEPEDECATMFLRLRKAALKKGTQVATVAPFLSAGSQKMNARLIPAVPGTEADILRAIKEGAGEHGATLEALRAEGAVVLIGERTGLVPGALEAAAQVAEAAGAKWAWVPRRAGERAAIEAGCYPGLLPGGRLVSDPEARADLAAVWGAKAQLDGENAFCINWSFDQVLSGNLDCLVVGGVDLRDLPDPVRAREVLGKAPHVIQLEVRKSAVTEYADVVLPVAPPHEKTGTFINWEGRLCAFGQALATRALPDWKVMQLLGRAAGVDLGLDSVADILKEYQELAGWDGARNDAPFHEDRPVPSPELGQAILATWKPLLDAGRCQDGEPDLANTARVPVVRLNAATAAENALHEAVKISGPAGSVILPVVIDDLPDRVVWMPQCSPGSLVHETLGATSGSLVTLKAAEV